MVFAMTRVNYNNLLHIVNSGVAEESHLTKMQEYKAP